METETCGEIKIIDGKGWVKRESIEKSITQIGSNPANDIVLDISRGKGVAARHAQIICRADAQQGYRLVNLGDTDIQIGASDERTISPRAAMDINNGEVFQIGEFTLVAELGDVVRRATGSATSGEHIGLELLLPNTPLIPNRRLDGAIVLGNLGEEENVQFTIDLEGLPEECYRIEPAPTLFPGAEKRIRFHLDHRGSLPRAGRRQIVIHAVAPNAYPGEEATVSRMIEVLPHYQHRLRLVSSDAVEVVGKKGRPTQAGSAPLAPRVGSTPSAPRVGTAPSAPRARERSSTRAGSTPSAPRAKERPSAPDAEEPSAPSKEGPAARPRRKPLAQIGTWWGRMFEPRGAPPPEITLEDVFSAEARQAGTRSRQRSELQAEVARTPRLGPELVEGLPPDAPRVETGAEPGAQVVPVAQVEPVVEVEPVFEPEPVAEADPVFEPEPVAEAEPIVKAEPVFEPEPIAEAEPVFEPEPIVKAEPVFEPEPIAEAEPVFETEPIVDIEPVAEQEIPVPQPTVVEDALPQEKENWWGLQDEGSDAGGDEWLAERDEGSDATDEWLAEGDEEPDATDGWFAEDQDALPAPPPRESVPARPRKVRVLKTRTPKEEVPAAVSSPQGDGDWWGEAEGGKEE